MLLLRFLGQRKHLVMPRLAKTERSGYWATTLSYGFVAPFFVAAGGIIGPRNVRKVWLLRKRSNNDVGNARRSCFTLS